VKRPVLDISIYGFDTWRAYEGSWLNIKGRPEVAILEIIYPRSSKYIVESKSLKLYLNSLANMRFSTSSDVKNLIKKDLGGVLDAEWITVKTIDLDSADSEDLWVKKIAGLCIDTLDVSINTYKRDIEALKIDDVYAEEVVYSNLLRTRCPITGQPDWASVIIHYKGPKVNHASLLKYIISYREYSGFSETCCDQIYMDITDKCRPEYLLVSLRFTRRGGIDINPVRASKDPDISNIPDWRLIRQ